MKRLTAAQRQHHMRRAAYELRHRRLRIRDKSEPKSPRETIRPWAELRRRIALTPQPVWSSLKQPIGRRRFRIVEQFHAPDVMNLEDKFGETMGFIYQLRRQAFELGRFSRFARRGIVADLSHCTSIDLSAALVVAAEFDRIRRVYNYHPKIVDDGWCSEVKELMGQLGLYELVEATNLPIEVKSVGPRSMEFVRFRSADDVNPVEAAELQDEIARKAGVDDPGKLLSLEPLIEAVSNSHQHAYPDNEGDCDIPFSGRWWAAGEIDRTELTLRFAVYDQGVGIPKTLPRKTYWTVFQTLLAKLGLAGSDADLVAGALEIGRSMTDLPGRGLGLDRIRRVADMLPEGRLRIWSGAGQVTYKGKEMWQPLQWERRALTVPFSGTMVEWQFKLVQAG